MRSKHIEHCFVELYSYIRFKEVKNYTINLARANTDFRCNPGVLNQSTFSVNILIHQIMPLLSLHKRIPFQLLWET